jgi:hypothetical protein
MSNPNNEVKDIINQLIQLQVTQTALLERLSRLETDRRLFEGLFDEEDSGPVARAPNPVARAPPPVVTTRRQSGRRIGRFAVGDRVRVLNPSRGQLDIGHITKIGIAQITLTDRRGEEIRRASKNLVLHNE